MYLILHCLLVLLFNQGTANGFNIFDIDFRFNYLNQEINAIKLSLSPEEEIASKWFHQELDHFNSKDSRTWKQKYYEELRYWKEEGPIYLFLGGEGDATPAWMSTGIMQDLAKETNGAMYITEHRYYGDSKPFNNADAENMQYLNSIQALADAAKIIKFLKSLSQYKDSKVVVIGGSYAGNLAAWMKVLYPKLIDAAIASSAPVLATKNFYKYLEKVNDDYEHYGQNDCIDRVKEVFKNYDSLLRSPEGIEKLKKDENICDSCDMTVLENQQFFFLSKIFPFMGSSQYGSPDTIKSHCQKLNDKNYYDSFIKDHTKVINFRENRCYSYDFNNYIKSIREKYNNDNMYAWLYQTCTEFGYFYTTTSKHQPFLNVPLEFFIKICNGVFGNNFNEKRVDKGVEISNKLYGGLKPNVTNVVFTNGDLDPWSTISVLEDLSHDARAVVIPRGSHCRDLFSDREEDSDELKKARKLVKFLIKNWIGAPNPVPVKYSDEYLNYMF